MKHRYWLRNLSAYLDNELSDSKRQKIEVHLKKCTICQLTLERWKNVEGFAKQESLLKPDQAIWYSISRRLKSEPVRPLHIWEDDWVSRYLPSPISAIATAVVALLLVLGMEPYLKSNDTTPVTIEQYLTNSIDNTSATVMDVGLTPSDNSQT